MKKIHLLLVIFSFFLNSLAKAQNTDARIAGLQVRLDSLSRTLPGLNKQVQLSLSGLPVADYLRALGRTANLNIYTDPSLNFNVNNTLSNVTASNILLLLAQQFNLDITSNGSILLIRPLQQSPPQVTIATKVPNVKYQQLDNTLFLDLSNDTLAAVTRKITLLSGKNILVPPTLQTKLVNGLINYSEFDVALNKLAFANEMKMVKTSDNFYLFQQLEEGEQLYVNGEQKTAVRRQFKPAANQTGNLGLFSRTVNGIKLLSVNAANASILDLVRSASQEMNKNYFIYSEIKGTISSINASDLDYESFLKLIFKGTIYSFNQENNVYTIGDRMLEGLRSNKAVLLKNRSIDTVMAMIPQDWRRDVEIKEFRELNTILLSGSRPQIEEIAGFIRQIDLLVPQVLIEVTLIDIHKTRRVSTGISAGTGDSIRTGGTILPGVDFTMGSASVNKLLNKAGNLFSANLGHVTPNFYLNISALEKKDNIEVRAIPQLSTLNGHVATLTIGNTRYYKNVTQNILSSAASNTAVFSNVYQPSEANMIINIKPIVSGDDQVTLGIKIDISDFTDQPTDGSPPPKSTSKFESIMRVHNEDMVVLGGLERTEDSENTSGVPLLSRIPLLKYLFSSRTRTKAKVITLVYIKPTILR